MDRDQAEEEPRWTHRLEGQSGGERARDEPAAGHEHEGPARPHHLPGGEIVVHLRDAQGIEGQGRGAEHEHHRVGHGPCGLRQPQGHHRRRGAADEGRAEHDPPAVEAVGEPAERPLGAKPADHHEGHEPRHLRHLEPDLAGIDRSHAEQPAMDEPGQHRRGHPERRSPVELGHGQPLRPARSRTRTRREEEGNEGEGHQDRDEQEEVELARVGGVEEELSTRGAGEHRDHVERQQPPAGPVGRLLIEPAFDDDIHPRVAESGHHPHRGPEHHLHEQGMHEDGDRRERREGGEHPDVADLPDEGRRKDRAREHPHEVAGHDRPGGGGRKFFEGGPQRDEGSLETVRNHDERGPGKERPRPTSHAAAAPFPLHRTAPRPGSAGAREPAPAHFLIRGWTRKPVHLPFFDHFIDVPDFAWTPDRDRDRERSRNARDSPREPRGFHPVRQYRRLGRLRLAPDAARPRPFPRP